MRSYRYEGCVYSIENFVSEIDDFREELYTL